MRCSLSSRLLGAFSSLQNTDRRGHDAETCLIEALEADLRHLGTVSRGTCCLRDGFRPPCSLKRVSNRPVDIRSHLPRSFHGVSMWRNIFLKSCGTKAMACLTETGSDLPHVVPSCVISRPKRLHTTPFLLALSCLSSEIPTWVIAKMLRRPLVRSKGSVLCASSKAILATWRCLR